MHINRVFFIRRLGETAPLLLPIVISKFLPYLFAGITATQSLACKLTGPNLKDFANTDPSKVVIRRIYHRIGIDPLRRPGEIISA